MTTKDAPRTKLEAVLQEKGVAKRELARRLLPGGASKGDIDNKRSQVGRWANGSVKMSEESAYAVAAALGLPPGTFLTQPNPQPSGLPRKVAQLEKEVAGLRDELAEIREAVLELTALEGKRGPI